ARCHSFHNKSPDLQCHISCVGSSVYCRGAPSRPCGRPGRSPCPFVIVERRPSRSLWPLCYHEHITILFDAQKKGGHSFLLLSITGEEPTVSAFVWLVLFVSPLISMH